ncbi:hypothetical protein ACU686_36015 [Yinghuangia aomiensis]
MKPYNSATLLWAMRVASPVGTSVSITERGSPPLVWTRADGYKFCSAPSQLQAYEGAVIREKLTEIRRFITGGVAPHPDLQPKGRWIKHLITQLNSVESTLDVIADYSETWPTNCARLRAS